MPATYKLIPGLHIHCIEQYYYELPINNNGSNELINRLFSRVLKTYCS